MEVPEELQAHTPDTVLGVLDALTCAFKQFYRYLQSTIEKTEVKYLVQSHKAIIWESQELNSAPSDPGASLLLVSGKDQRENQRREENSVSAFH